MLNKEAIDSKVEELQAKARRIQELGTIYEKTVENMNWYGMDYHEADDEHEERWFSAPDEESYKYDTYLAYQEVLEAIEKLMK
jgi:hypothetical protein